jgi:hypothetical protein
MRFDKLVIKLSKQERADIYKLAEREKLPPSTMARAMLLKAANSQSINANSDVIRQDFTVAVAL